MIFLVILGIIVVALYVIGVYNGLVTGQVQTKEAWSTVDTQLKRRYDLIPNIVETVRGYAKHESKTLENVINARTMAMSINGSSVQKEQHENMLSGALKSIFALSESYPDLKANQNFLHLQQELADTETKIQAARQYYNTAVMALNRKVRIFPNNVIAGMFGIEQEHFFELEASEKEAVKVAPKIQF